MLLWRAKGGRTLYILLRAQLCACYSVFHLRFAMPSTVAQQAICLWELDKGWPAFFVADIISSY